MQLTYKKLKPFALSYLTAPLAVFFAGYLRAPFAVAGLAVLAFAWWYAVCKTPQVKQVGQEEQGITLSVPKLVLLFALMLLWGYLGGQTGFFYQNSDWGYRNAIYRDLITNSWQVYYLHNRVDNIEACAAHVSQMVPGARVGIAHGKMTEEELNPVWQHLLNGEIDILVCTTLIETGIDVRNCNTLIIEDADRMGLAQLYQIRGRVGRSGRKAYAYFTFRRDKTLTDIAQKRLSAIREFTAFGSGFRIAMRDLQIRGAGSLLGHSQHGHMEAVGYDLYVKMLGQAIARAKGEPVQRDKSECLVDLRVDAYIPEKYIADGPGRIEAYKRIAAIQTPEDAADVLDELIDRYGDPPPSVSDLVNVSLVRVQATAVGVYEVTQKKDTIVLNLEHLDVPMIRGLLVAFNGRVTAGAGSKPYLSVTLHPDEKPLELLQSILKAMAEILKPAE